MVTREKNYLIVPSYNIYILACFMATYQVIKHIFSKCSQQFINISADKQHKKSTSDLSLEVDGCTNFLILATLSKSRGYYLKCLHLGQTIQLR